VSDDTRGELCFLSAHELREGYLQRDFSPVEAVSAIADRITTLDPSINAFTTLSLDRALDEAQAATDAYASPNNGTRRPLEGVPIAVKDLFDTEGIRTTYGSALFNGHVPTEDARAVRLAKAAGCIVVGKTTTHEFGWGITSNNPHFGPVRNPWNLERVPGGSSGGSAAALAIGEVPLALGSDTGGSIRIPAAFCGVVGFKPTFARVPVGGVFPLAFSLDHAGPMARTPADALLLLEAIGVGWAVPRRPRRDASENRLAGARIGVSPDLHLVELAPDVERVFNDTLTTLRELGAECVELDLPSAGEILETFVTIQRVEASLAHRSTGLFPVRGSDYGSDVHDRLKAASEVTFGEYLAALKARRRLHEEFLDLLSGVDALVTPISAVPPAVIGEDTVSHDGRTVSFRDAVMSYTVPQDLFGVPACAVRAGFDRSGLPVGVQFTGLPWMDRAVLLLAGSFFDHTGAIQAAWPASVERESTGVED
jgi:aspartyl-tRNA(Asn)/glutamyl-tRNA(Gln) amidotransferase subunit A